MSNSWNIYFDCYAYLDKDSISELNQLYTEDSEILSFADIETKVKLSLCFSPLTNETTCIAVNDKLVIRSHSSEMFEIDHDSLTFSKFS